MKRTFKGKQVKRNRTHGFLVRSRDAAHVIAAKRRKGRHTISVTCSK